MAVAVVDEARIGQGVEPQHRAVGPPYVYTAGSQIWIVREVARVVFKKEGIPASLLPSHPCGGRVTAGYVLKAHKIICSSTGVMIHYPVRLTRRAQFTQK